MEFSITEITTEEITNHLGAKEAVETLVCSVTIDGTTKSVRFHWIKHRDIYTSNDRNLVYVRIPQQRTKRSKTIDPYKTYFNKVRGARLYVQKKHLEYKLIPTYKVLDGIAEIVSWTDSPRGLDLEKERAIDGEIPMPYLEKGGQTFYVDD